MCSVHAWGCVCLCLLSLWCCIDVPLSKICFGVGIHFNFNLKSLLTYSYSSAFIYFHFNLVFLSHIICLCAFIPANILDSLYFFVLLWAWWKFDCCHWVIVSAEPWASLGLTIFIPFQKNICNLNALKCSLAALVASGNFWEQNHFVIVVNWRDGSAAAPFHDL